MMIKFDHLVHFNLHPSQAQSVFQSFGFNAIKGGNHPNWGTHNSLCYFKGLRYIEWIGIKDMKVAIASDNVLIQQVVKDSTLAEGFSQLAFRTDNLAALATSLNEKGLLTVGPVNGSRKKEDGTILSWSMLFITEDGENKLRYPFFIQWGQTEEVRELEMQPIIQHLNGTPVLSYLGFIVKSRMDAIQKYSLIFNFDTKNIPEKQDSYGVYSELLIGDFMMRFYEPSQKKTQQLYEKFGERPFLCGITGVNEDIVAHVNGGIYEFGE